MEAARPAGFWMRAVAALVDFSVFFVVQISFGYVAAGVGGPDVEELAGFLPLVWLFTLIFAGAYTTVLHALVGGQTVGKMLVGIRVVDINGAPVPVGAALLRFAGYFVSLAVFALGYLMAGLRRDKRALHDLLAGTRVEHVATEQTVAPAAEPVDPARAS